MTTAVEEETPGYSDEEHLRYAADRDWPLLTFDDNFLLLVDSELAELDHVGIIYTSYKASFEGIPTDWINPEWLLPNLVKQQTGC